MNRIAPRFDALRGANRKALIPYVTAGDPDPSVTVPLLHALVEAGADAVEIGVPFSDPMADGPVIQRAAERALARGVTLSRVLELVARFRAGDPDTPVVLMGYLNPVEAMGYERFAHAAADAGVDGLLSVDLPPEEADPLLAALHERSLDAIFLLAPTTSDERMTRICDRASGFVYYVSLKGVTGAANLDARSVGERVSRIKRVTDLPVGVGFGIRDATTAAAVGAVSDAVIVGSVLVQRIESLAAQPAQIPDTVAGLLAPMRAALDALDEPAVPATDAHAS